MTKTIAVLGATGSVGMQSIDVARQRGYKIDFFSAGRNSALAERLAREIRPAAVAMADMRIPARRHRATASFASGRGGSIMPTRPRKVKFCSTVSEVSCVGISAISRYATARTRRAFSLICSVICRAVSRLPDTQRAESTSNAPLTIAMFLFSIRWMVVISLRSESKGSSARRGKRSLRVSLGRLFWCAARTMALSVGSPMCSALPSWNVTEALQQSVAQVRSLRIASLFCSEIASGVSLPSVYSGEM